ncbi:MAG: hypothetical protein ACRECY_16275 [Phyllobacterium sp.]
MSTMTHQPELRALMMFDKLPAGCISFLVTDDYSLPHIRPGELVVVDTNDTRPRNGELSVIQWQSGRRQVCQSRISTKFREDDGSPTWSVGSLRHPDIETWLKSERAAGRVPIYPGWSEGWFDSEHLQSKLVGAVIGIYQPNFEEPRRIVS